MREYLSLPVSIDGRTIPYTVVYAGDYFKEHDHVTDLEEFQEYNEEIWSLVTQIIAIKQSCFLLRHTSYSDQSLSDSLYELKLRLIKELRDVHNYVFDDSWMDSLVPESYDVKLFKERF